MSELDLIHFEELKSRIQATYLKNHTPSEEEISSWKGIDIIYFQEDLRKITKGNISEKSFYTYFKTSPVQKLPRIDVLNILSQYAGYASWYDFKKNHATTTDIQSDKSDPEQSNVNNTDLSATVENVPNVIASDQTAQKTPTTNSTKSDVLQKINTDNERITEFNQNPSEQNTTAKIFDKKKSNRKAKWIYALVSFPIILASIAYTYRAELFSKEYYYTFVDSDRNQIIGAELQVQILKENESPILYTAKPNEPFVYKNPSDNTLTMVVSSPYYRSDTIKRNLESAPESETFELKPNDYAIMLYYYSNSIPDVKRKRDNLSKLISDDALIYQVYDNNTYGIETMDKQRYINLVTLPSTSLKNMEVIDTKMDKGKIVLIKFRIPTTDEIPE